MMISDDGAFVENCDGINNENEKNSFCVCVYNIIKQLLWVYVYKSSVKFSISSASVNK